MTSHLFTGLGVGLAVAVPVGPIALLILRRTLTEGRLAGFISGLGAAAADTFCAVLACLFLGTLRTFLHDHDTLVHVIGGGFMLGIGFKLARSRPAANAANRPLHERNLFTAFWSTALLTLANPMTILGMVGLVAATGTPPHLTPAQSATSLTLGICLGSTAWWLVLTFFAAKLGRALNPRSLALLNRLAGAGLILFGAYQLARIVSAHL